MPRLAPVTTATGSSERAGMVIAQSPLDCRKETHVAYLATDPVTASFTPYAGRPCFLRETETRDLERTLAPRWRSYSSPRQVSGGPVLSKLVPGGPMNKQVEVVHSVGRPTMKDVASKAGVALKTVSRVVNGEAGVTPQTAKRVRGAIEDLGFRRNESARLLRTGQTATLGFIADDWTNADQAAVYRGLEDVARANGYLLYSGSTDRDAEREEQLALAMCARRVDGLIIIPTPGSHDYLVSEIEAGVATVFVLYPPDLGPPDLGPPGLGPPGLGPPGLVRADAVLPDARGAAGAAIAHLAAHGHRRIGFVGGPAGEQRAALLDGYAQA